MRSVTVLAFFVLVLPSTLPSAQRASLQPRPDTVWVDDDFGPATSGWGRTRFATLEEGVLYVKVGGTVQVGPGTYPEALVLAKRVHLRGAGAQLTTILAQPGADMLTLWAAGASVRGFRFQNDLEPRAALVVRANRCTVAENELAGNALDIRIWPYVEDLTDLVLADNRGIAILELGFPGYYPVRASRIERNQARSIRVKSGLDLHIEGNEIDTASAGVYFPGIELSECPGCEVRENSVRSGEAGITLVHSPGALVVANQVTGDFYQGIVVRTGSDDAVVQENVLSQGSGTGIRVAYVERVRVLGNRIDLPTGAMGIQLDDSESDRLEGNALTGCGIVVRGELPLAWDTHVLTDNTLDGRPIVYEVGQSGFVAPADAAQVILARCNGFAIEGLRFPAGAPGVQLAGCDAGAVRGCTFRASAPSAVYANGCIGLELDENLVLDAPEVGQAVASGFALEHCSAGFLRGNYLAFSVLGPGRGLELLHCEGLEITGNTLANYGSLLLYRYGPGGSRIHGNAFCSYYGLTDDCVNAWDDGNGAGNYWDDYAGVDADGDGIGDTPHTLHGFVVDAYPLMAPPGGALLWSGRHALSLTSGGSSTLVLETGRARAGQHYLILGSASGTEPGTHFGGVHLSLNRDAYFRDVLARPSADGRTGFSGVLDADGRAVATLTLSPGTDPASIGTTLHHAGCLVVLEPLGSPPGFSLRVEAGTRAVPLFLLE